MRRLLLPLALFAVLSAHIGSPNVLFDGTAGPYPVRVVVRPPSVVPGRADVTVEVNAADVASVNVRPVFWRVGVAGAPTGDAAARVAGSANVYTGQIWLMSRGSYSVYVTVNGARGSGTAIVPVNALATGRLGLSPGLSAVLVVLGLLLFAGLVTIIRAASGEALLEPGQPVTAQTKRRARFAGSIAALVVASLVLGGARWWKSVDSDYQRTMYKPPALDANVRKDDGRDVLWLRVHDTAAFHAIFSPVIPDHGKMMHLFVVKAGTHDIFGHFHPTEVDSLRFRASLAGLPAGRYKLFGDIVLANGLSQTVTNTVDWPGDVDQTRPDDPDDSAWPTCCTALIQRNAPAPIGDGFVMAWSGGDAPIVARRPVDLKFEVRNAKGEVAPLSPYMGMAGHAAVLSADESVFIHLHPMGTVSTSAQAAFAARDRGDTTVAGRLRLAPSDTTPMTMPMDGRLSFPYEFPKPGRYRMWVQVKPNSQILTGVFDVDVR